MELICTKQGILFFIIFFFLNESAIYAPGLMDERL